MEGGVTMEKGNRIEQVSNEVVEKSLAVLQDKIDRIILYGSYARGILMKNQM